MLNVAPISQTYNGYCNRETWLANLWLSNDDGCYALQEALRNGEDVGEQAEYLERTLRDQLDDEVDGASLWGDLLHTAFDRINWFEIIENNK